MMSEHNQVLLGTMLCKVDGMNYGDRLVHALATSAKSRLELAHAIGASTQAISQVINGASKSLNAENTLRAARFLKVSAWWLATGEGTPVDNWSICERLSDEAISYAVEYEAMTPQEREQFRMLMAASIAGRGWSVSNFGGLTDY
jgi:transcriptional regulator with XRE-family HTH domain